MDKFLEFNQDILLRQLIREELDRKILYEGLVFTYSLQSLYSSLKKIGFKKEDFEFNPMINVILVYFSLNKQNKERYEKLNHLMDSIGGWFHGVSTGGIILKDKLDFIKKEEGQVVLQYEPKHDIEIAVPDVLYHLTKQNRVDKIKKVGLTPRSSELFFNYKDRIYFALDKKSLKKLAEQKKQIDLIKIREKVLGNKYKDKNQELFELEQSSKFVILTINPKGSSFGIRFFKDSNFFDGVYTKENLHPFSIKDIEYFEI